MKIFITGGTSGIGLAIAIQYLETGHEVGICGRDIKKVQLEKSYPFLKMYQLDVYDKNRLEEAVSDFANQSLDIMILSAGNYSDSALYYLTYEESTEMLRCNIAGAVNSLEIARDHMHLKRKGHIAIIASVSGLLDYPKATIYSKTKRALIQIADAYRRALENFGINVTIIAPGYVNSPRLRELNNDDLSKKPFVVDCSYAASIIIKGIEEKKKRIVFPPKMKYLIGFLSMLPTPLLTYIMLKRVKRQKNG